jgi:PAS domain S-box-containing protein
MTAVPSPVNEVLRLGNVVKPTRQTLLFRPDETQVPIEVNAAPIRSKETHVAGAVLVFRNVTDRRQFEKQLQEREQHLRRMLQTPLIGIAVCESDGRRLLEANETFLNLIGSTTGSWAGSTLSWDGITTTRGPLDDAAQKEIAESGLCRPFEKSCRRADGKVVPVLISANKLSDEDDRIIVFVTDLSESKRSEASLKESENRFLILSESMPQIVWLARVNGDLNYVNQTFVNFAGRNKESLTEWGWIDLIHPDDRDAHVNAWKKSIMSAEPFEAEHRLQDHTGDYRWHLTRALPMYNDASEITQWIGTMTDIHDHKQVEAFLKEEHHRKDQFLAMLAHELRNPLAPLANVVEILTAAPHDPQVLNEVLPIMKRKVRLLTRLIDDLLDVARITQGRIVLKCQPVSVQSIVTNAVETAQQWITQSEHELTITVPPEELFINADKTRMVQVLMNLLQNAAKYTNPKGQLALTVTHTPCEVCFSVRDNGQGLSALMLTRIFDLFMHVEPTLDRTPGGLGIGLSVVRTLVELHGGTVAAKSEGLGRGSEFLVRMPLIDAEQKDAQNSNGAVDRNNRGLPEANRNAVSKSGSTTAPLPALRILVVDDVKASAKTLAMMLKALGQDVEMAFDGVSALARLQETDFDLAFLDIAMPGMDGLEVARQLRASNGAVSPEVTLVALTGFDQDDDRRRSLDAGFNQHLIKPTSLNLLRDVLQAVVDRKASAGKSAQA